MSSNTYSKLQKPTIKRIAEKKDRLDCTIGQKYFVELQVIRSWGNRKRHKIQF